ncbi:MAG: hypothetical protein ACE5SW_08455 [Nitrososphaeraceae archaeon]
MSLEFKKMIEIILERQPEITAEQIRDLIDEKKRKIGAGYLTDQGALFLVAADLGISFDNTQDSQTTIKDLYIGAQDVNLLARIISIYPIKKYTRRDTNEEIQNRTLTIYDNFTSIKLRLWDNHVNFPEVERLKPGDLVKISHGYVKSGLDNKPVINLGARGSIEIYNEQSDIPFIETITKNIDDIKEPVENTAVIGYISSNPRISRYTNFRNEPGKSLQIVLTNKEENISFRTLIWNINEEKIPEIFTKGSKIKLIGVKIKEGNPQYSSEQLEIHGDEGTQIETIDSEEKLEEGKVVVLKIISNSSVEDSLNENFLAIDKERNFVSVVIYQKLIDEEIQANNIIEGIPNKIFGNIYYFTNEDSFIRVIQEKDESFPNNLELESKIKEMEISENPYILEAIVLKPPNTSEITLKNGENVLVTDTLIGDDTGEIRVTGWREQSKKISKLMVGNRIKVIGAIATMGRENQLELTLKGFSEIRKIS